MVCKQSKLSRGGRSKQIHFNDSRIYETFGHKSVTLDYFRGILCQQHKTCEWNNGMHSEFNERIKYKSPFAWCFKLQNHFSFGCSSNFSKSNVHCWDHDTNTKSWKQILSLFLKFQFSRDLHRNSRQSVSIMHGASFRNYMAGYYFHKDMDKWEKNVFIKQLQFYGIMQFLKL